MADPIVSFADFEGSNATAVRIEPDIPGLAVSGEVSVALDPIEIRIEVALQDPLDRLLARLIGGQGCQVGVELFGKLVFLHGSSFS